MINYKTYLVFLFGSLAFSIGIQLLASYLNWPPFSGVAIALAVFIIFPLVLRNRSLKRMGGMGSDAGVGAADFLDRIKVSSIFALHATINTRAECVQDAALK